jgi:hypothetical protein
MMPPFILFNIWHPGRIVKGGFLTSAMQPDVLLEYSPGASRQGKEDSNETFTSLGVLESLSFSISVNIMEMRYKVLFSYLHVTCQEACHCLGCSQLRTGIGYIDTTSMFQL